MKEFDYNEYLFAILHFKVCIKHTNIPIRVMTRFLEKEVNQMKNHDFAQAYAYCLI